MAGNGRQWPAMAANGRRRPQMVVDGRRWLQVVADGRRMVADGRNRPQLAAGWLQVTAGVRRCGSRCEQSLFRHGVAGVPLLAFGWLVLTCSSLSRGAPGLEFTC